VKPNTFQSPDGLTLAWYELGGGDALPPIMMQHGFSSSTEHEWVECKIVDDLAVLGRRMIGIDARGHGNSDKPHDPARYGAHFMARDVIALVSHLGIEQYDLVGYSMGGTIVTLVASLDPRVRRVAIGGVGHGLVNRGGLDPKVLDSRALSDALRADSEEGLSGRVLEFRRAAIERDNDLLALAAHSEAAKSREIDFEAITAEAMILAGDDDPLAEHPEILASAIRGDRLTMVPGDHHASKRSPEFRRALVEFLR
jgi:pimeloyl-ACP methyl ester carboxylesterase